MKAVSLARLFAIFLTLSPIPAEAEDKVSGAVEALHFEDGAEDPSRRPAALGAQARAETPPNILPSQQEMVGFKLLEKNENFQRFTFRENGQFLISQKSFSTRKEALEFCQAQKGFELADWRLQGLIAISGLPFEDLQRNSYTDKAVLEGPYHLTGGAIFWSKGTNKDEERDLSRGADSVYEMLNGCGPNCDGIEPLSAINKRLARLKAAPMQPQAICASEKLNKAFSR